MIFVSIDVGRSSVKATAKCGNKTDTLSFPSIFSDSWSTFSDKDNKFVTTSFRTNKHCFSLDEKYRDEFFPHQVYLFGETAEELGHSPNTFKESDSFHKFSVYATTYVVAYFCNKFRDYEVSAAVNLTFTNVHAQEFYSKALKKTFYLRLWDEGTPLKFTIQELFCFQQGYAAIFNFLNTPQFSELMDTTTLIVDIGKHTSDLSLVKSFTLVDGTSINIGTSQAIQKIKQYCSSVAELTDFQIEVALQKPSTFYQSIKGEKILPSEVAVKYEVFEKVYKDIYSRIIDFVDRQSIHHLYLVGGGSNMFSKQFEKDFKLPKLPSEGIYSNAKGMLKFITSGVS